MAPEPRLVNANAIKYREKDEYCGNGNSRPVRYVFDEDIAELPTVDAVEVIRCENCKHAVWDEENEMWKCVESAEYDEKLGEWFGFYEYHNGDFFCALGERRCGE